MVDINLGYLGFVIQNNSIYSGGLMVCDSKGFPLEFRYSEPIKPSKVQQVLYGNVLDKYIKVDVIAESLLKSSTTSFNIMIVQEEYLLDQKFTSQFAVIRISPTKSPPLAAQGESIKIKDREYLLQASINTNPVRVQFSSLLSPTDQIIIDTLQSLGKSGVTMDLDEPISRVYRALELICQQTQKQESNP